MQKFTVEQIRKRFDQDVERFSNLETGQTATIDAPIAMELIAAAAARVTPHATAAVDIGCGAGNYTLKLLERLPLLEITLMDLSQPMLDRALQRVGAAAQAPVHILQADIREAALAEGSCDIVIAAAVLHHLRGEEEWETVFAKIFAALRRGGSFWISDLIEHDHSAVQAVMWERYGDYLAGLRDAFYRDHVFAYIAQEDSPRSVLFQTDLLRKVGFSGVEILHKNGCFAAFGAWKQP